MLDIRIFSPIIIALGTSERQNTDPLHNLKISTKYQVTSLSLIQNILFSRTFTCNRIYAPCTYCNIVPQPSQLYTFCVNKHKKHAKGNSVGYMEFWAAKVQLTVHFICLVCTNVCYCLI